MSHGIKKKASLLHILCGCEHAMKEDKLARRSGQKGHIGRITWRHDSIMFAIFRGVLRVVKRFKKENQEKKLGVSATTVCKVLGFTKEERRGLKFELQKTARHCSHAIVAARYTAEWPPRPLLDVSDWQGSFACGDNKHEQQVTAG